MGIEEEDDVIDEVIVEDEIIEESDISEDDETPEEDQEDEEDRIVTIGEPETSEEDETSEEEEEHTEAPAWVKKVRKANREKDREIKRLKKQLEVREKPVEEELQLSEKPTLESSGFDDKKFEKDLLDWHENNKKVEKQKAEKQKIVEKQSKDWQIKQERYVNLRKEHNFKDFKEAEEVVSESFTKTQQGIIVQGADDPALLVYALGKNPKKLEELLKLTDPVEFAFKLAKLEAQLKVTNKKAPAPEKRVSGGNTGSGSTDKTLNKLREEADRTGNFTKLNQYKRQLRGAK